MELAMLLIGLLLGGCVSFCILGCMQINRINDYEDEIRRLRAKEPNRISNKSTAVSIVLRTKDTAFLFSERLTASK